MANKKINKLTNADTVKVTENKSEESQVAAAPVNVDVTEALTSTKTAAVKDKKSIAKKSPEKDTENFFIEFGASKFSAEEIIEKCKEAYKANNPRKQIRTIKVYVKPEDNKAYYVINNKADGLYVDL